LKVSFSPLVPERSAAARETTVPWMAKGTLLGCVRCVFGFVYVRWIVPYRTRVVFYTVVRFGGLTDLGMPVVISTSETSSDEVMICIYVWSCQL
jgi:hypothetical protein